MVTTKQTVKAPPAAGLDLEVLRSLLKDTMTEEMKPLREEIAELRSKVQEQERATPKFVPMQHKNQSGMPKTPEEHLRAMANLREGQTREGSIHEIPTTQNGKRMDQGALKALFDSYQPPFQPGDTVRINPDAERLGWPEGKTWGQLLAKAKQNPDGYGVIREIAPFSHRGWMFRARIEGHTGERGMVFDAHELVAV